MPNGEDKNWIRACAVLDSFYARYGHWPTRLRFPTYAFEDFQHLFKKHTLRRFLARFEIVVDNSMFAAESEGGRRFDYMNEDVFATGQQVSAAKYFSWYPDAGRPDRERETADQLSDGECHYDLFLAGRVVRYLSPAEVVREVIRFLMHDVQLDAAAINGRAATRLLREYTPQAGQPPRLPVGLWALRTFDGHWHVLDQHRDWSDYLTLLYRLEDAAPFGTIHWRESAMLEKRTVVDRLQLLPHGAFPRKRYVAPLPDALAPLPDSYRVCELPLFAGVCPRTKEEEHALAAFGVDCIVDLRSHRESDSSVLGWGEVPPEHHRYPLEPGQVPIRDAVANIHMVINDCLDRGKIVYLHDKGGLGRSTTVLACLLVEWGLTPNEAMEQVRSLSRRMPKAAGREIPETDAQVQFVMQWRGTAKR